MIKASILAVLLAVLTLAADPLPPVGLPPKFSAAITFSYINSSYNPPRITYVKQQQIIVDATDLMVCRSSENQLKPPSGYFYDVYFCDYRKSQNIRWRMNYESSSCYKTFADPPTFPSLNFPSDFQNAQYLGKEPVGNLYCDHWYQMFADNAGDIIDLDVYSNGTTICRVEVQTRGTNGLVWVFDGFTTDINSDSFQYCTPEQNCDNSVLKTCVAFSNATDDKLKNAISGACAVVDCTSITTGPLMNYTLLEKANFAVAQYYAGYAVANGDKAACDWDGAAGIETLTPPPPPPGPLANNDYDNDNDNNMKRRITSNDDGNFILFASNIACDDGLSPWNFVSN